MKNNIRFLTLAGALVAGLTHALAQSTAFNYQGQLTENGTPVTKKNFDMIFAVFDSAGGIGQVGTDNIIDPVGVTNGLFNVTLNFGSGIFTGPDRWLQIRVRPSGSAVTHTKLSPRQPLLPTPYAIHAASAGTVATATSASAAPWSGLTGLPAGFADNVDNDTLYSAGAGLSLSGTTFSLNTAFTDALYWKLLGNAGTTAGTHFLGTTDNQPLDLRVNGARALRLEPHATSPKLIGGHAGNFVDAAAVGATIGGGGTTGQTNKVTGSYGAIGGGLGNTLSSPESVIGGGSGNTIQAPAFQSTICGGYSNTVQAADRSTIAGGFANTIQDQAFRSFIGGGSENRVATRADLSTIGGGGANLIGTNAYRSVIGGGSDNRADALWTTISGGAGNVVETNATHGTVAGGERNRISSGADHASVGGGDDNVIQAGGGRAVIGGGSGNRIGPAAFVTINGGVGNEVQNTAHYASIGGGDHNRVSPNAARATIGGGGDNVSAAADATVGGGAENAASGDSATVPGGRQNVASGQYSFAAGQRSKALHDGSFVWADSQNTDFASAVPNEFTIRAAGGVRLETAGAGLTLDGARLLGGSGTANYLPLFTGIGTLGNSGIFQSGGRIGIGTTTPNFSSLHVKSFANNNEAIRVIGNGANGSGGQIVFGASDVKTYISEGEDDGIYLVAPLGVGVGPGNVGIGVSSLSQATHRLTVVSSPQNDNVLRLIGRQGTESYGAKLTFGDGDTAFVGAYIQEDFNDWLQIYAAAGTRILGGNVGIGTTSPQQMLDVAGTTRTRVLQITGGADIAEPFPVSTKDIPKGAVMVIDEERPGHLKMSERAHDTRAAGIMSGANGINPGIILHQEGVLEGEEHVALNGRVYALADAAQGAIKPGDLLTTSDVPGHAMKVTDHAKAQGAIIGKAMSALTEGKGMVLVLVSLQ